MESHEPAPGKTECGWVKLYTPDGVLVTIPVTEKPLNYRSMLANVGAMLDAGFRLTLPGLEVGEDREEVGYVCKGVTKDNTTVLYLYSTNESYKYSVLNVYIDNDDQAADFEYASGMKLASLPEHIAGTKPQRGANAKLDAFIVKAKRPFSVIVGNNPEYDEAARQQCVARNEVYKKPRHLFVRWANQRPENPPAPTNAPAGGNSSGSSGGATPAPKTMKELVDRLQAWEAKLVSEKKSKIGEVFAFLVDWAKTYAAPAGLTHRSVDQWPDSAIMPATLALKNFEKRANPWT